jgi:hypothetical protein
MNDIERLIAGLPRPSPSAELDARIARLTSEPRVDRQAAGHGNGAPRRLMATVASAACAGLLGFALGRHSVEPVVAGQSATVGDVTPTDSIASAIPGRDQSVVTVQVPETEALARFVMPSKRSAGLFGSGPFVDQSESTHLE